MLTELLAKWAELEPGQCHQDGEVFWIRAGAEAPSWPIRVESRARTFLSSVAYLQCDLQHAIAARNLRCKVENNQDKWFADVLSVDKPQHTEGADSEPAIALLKAYVAWLEREAKS